MMAWGRDKEIGYCGFMEGFATAHHRQAMLSW